MTEDVLSRATHAVRDRYGGASELAPRTEELMLGRLAAQARRLRVLPMIGAPLLAAVLVSGAWATTSGRTEALVKGLTHALEPKISAKVAPGPRSPGSNGIPASLPSVLEIPGRPPTAPEPEVLLPTAHVSPSVHATRRVVGKAPPTQSNPFWDVAAPANQSEPSADDLYRAAHRAQFVDRDPAAAVEAWARYLSAAPSGSLALEARYNRAISLVKLGKKDDAVAALTPFARGDYGPYRQADAASLLLLLRTERSEIPPTQ